MDFLTAGQKVTFVINNEAFVKELPLVDKRKIGHFTLFRILFTFEPFTRTIN